MRLPAASVELLLLLVALPVPSAAVSSAAQIEVDEAVFFEEFKKLHPRGWANGEEGGAGLVAVLEKILGAPLVESAKLTCEEAFKTVSAKWRGGKDCYFLVFMGLFLLNLPYTHRETRD
eukprot:SAG31_NODE_5032_length_2791_cov_3.502972_4_plen_119_part_00